MGWITLPQPRTPVDKILVVDSGLIGVSLLDEKHKITLRRPFDKQTNWPNLLSFRVSILCFLDYKEIFQSASYNPWPPGPHSENLKMSRWASHTLPFSWWCITWVGNKSIKNRLKEHLFFQKRGKRAALIWRRKKEHPSWHEYIDPNLWTGMQIMMFVGPGTKWSDREMR
jgi:hypothetical protein